MNTRRMTLVALLVGAVGLLVAQPAAAQVGPLDRKVVTSDDEPAGSGRLEYRGGRFRLTACDDDRDGYGVRAYATAVGYPRLFSLLPRTVVAISDQGTGTCGARGRDPYTYIVAPAKWVISVKVCLRDHDGSRGGDRADHHCGPRQITWVPKRRR